MLSDGDDSEYIVNCIHFQTNILVKSLPLMPPGWVK